MVLWIILALMTAAVLVFVLWPLVDRKSETTMGRADFDAEVFRDQLSEISSDLERGLLSAEEAQSAKNEVSRRLLRAAEELHGENSSATRSADLKPSNQFFATIGTAILIPMIALTFYLAYGSPGVPGFAHSTRFNAPSEEQQIGALVARVEERLRTHPEDGQGWDVIAPVYLKQSRYQDAIVAYEHAIRILGESPQRLAGLGEAVVFSNNGIVVDGARQAFAKAQKADPTLSAPRFWLAIAMEQDGDFAGAAKAWEKLLADGPKDAPWRKLVEERLKFAQAHIGSDGQSFKSPQTQGQSKTNQSPRVASESKERGPDASDIEAARNMKPADRLAMINQMVAGLAERLKKDGDDLEGWQRLINSYAVLGNREAALQALDDARKNFAENAEALAKLDQLAKRLGLNS